MLFREGGGFTRSDRPENDRGIYTCARVSGSIGSDEVGICTKATPTRRRIIDSHLFRVRFLLSTATLAMAVVRSFS